MLKEFQNAYSDFVHIILPCLALPCLVEDPTQVLLIERSEDGGLGAGPHGIKNLEGCGECVGGYDVIVFYSLVGVWRFLRGECMRLVERMEERITLRWATAVETVSLRSC